MEKAEKDKKRYQNGKIYSIRSHQTDDIYIGSTINTLPKRFHKHKSNYKRFLSSKSNNWFSSFDIIKFDDCYIELIENYPCNDRNELERQEGIHIRNTTDCINKRVAGRTKKEHYIEHRYEMKIKNKKYYDNHREKHRKCVKAYQIKNKELISQQAKARYQAKKLAKLNNQSII